MNRRRFPHRLCDYAKRDDHEPSISMVTEAEQLLERARAGDPNALGQLLNLYRHYLSLLARLQVTRRLQGKVDASDLVQEAFLDAHRHFEKFRGTSENQFLHWLRQILAAKLADQWRRYLGAKRRDIRQERVMAADLDRSSALLERGFAASISSPSQQVTRREQAVILANALGQLPDHYREVLVLRHLEGLTFSQVAARMGRTLDSVEKLWLRALARLRELMGAANETD
jgi:RNA polymerase sigma-70 factor (ECF subfamily)